MLCCFAASLHSDSDKLMELCLSSRGAWDKQQLPQSYQQSEWAQQAAGSLRVLRKRGETKSTDSKVKVIVVKYFNNGK